MFIQLIFRKKMETAQEHILSGNLELTQASSGKRLANYLIDRVIIQLLLVLFPLLADMVNQALLDEIAVTSVVDSLLSFLCYVSNKCSERFESSVSR